MNEALGVLEVGDWLPSCIVERVAEQLDEVLDLTSVGALGQDCLDFVLGLIVDEVGRRRRWSARK